MRLCLDEHYSPQVAAALRDLGLDVTSVKERADLAGLSDSALLAACRGERRALLTENVADFAPLMAQVAAAGESHYGIVYSSPRSMPRSRETIGPYARALAALLDRYPGDEDFVNQTAWLNPVDSSN